jgi:hypothetical protein
MKKFLIGGLLSACTLLVTSCLEGGSNEVSNSGVPGVVRFDMKTMKTVIDSPEFYPFAFYDSNMEKNVQLSELKEDDCILFGYRVNFSDEVNANYQTAGIVNGTLTSIALLTKYYVQPTIGDTSALLEKEQPIAYAVANTGGYLYLSKKLFLLSNFQQKDEQVTDWILCFDSSLPTKMINGRKVYSLFLRARILSEGKLTGADSVINAFEAGNFFEQIMFIEDAEGQSEVYFQINHINDIKEDGSFTWTTSEVLSLAIPQS